MLSFQRLASHDDAISCPKTGPTSCHCDREPPMFEIANGHYFGFDGTHFEVQSSQSVKSAISG